MRRIGEYALFILSALGSIASIISVLYSELAAEEKVLYSILFIGAAMLFFMIYSTYLVLTYRRTINYAPALHTLGIGFSRLHDLTRQPRKATDEEQG